MTPSPVESLADPAAERAALAGAFRHGPEAWLEIDDLWTERTLTVNSNQFIYRCLRHLYQANPECVPDVPSILSAANSLGLSGFFADPDEIRHLRAIAISTPVELGNVRALATKVRKLEVARAAVEATEQARGKLLGVTGDEPIDAILELLEGPVARFGDSIASTGEGAPRAIGQGILEWLDHIESNPVDMLGMPSGFREMDEALGDGLKPGCITLIGARSGIGKSHIGVNVAMRLACGCGYDWPNLDVRERVPVLYLDTEMQENDHRFRGLGNLCGVSARKLKRGTYAKDPTWQRKVREAAKYLESVPYEMLSIAGQPFEETLGTMRRWIRRRVGLGPDGKAKPCLIVFDYVKLMDSSGLSKNIAEFQQLGFIMTGLHNFAVRYNVPILAFCQLNRDGINVEETNAIGGSDRLLWLASDLLLYKPLTEEEIAALANQGVFTHKFVVLKSRHGPGLPSKHFIAMRADYDCSRVTEGPVAMHQVVAVPDHDDDGDEPPRRRRRRKENPHAGDDF